MRRYWLSLFLAVTSGGIAWAQPPVHLTARGIPVVTFVTDSCPGTPCTTGSGDCISYQFHAPVQLAIDANITDSTMTGCIQTDGSSCLPNGAYTCCAASGSLNIQKPSGNLLEGVVGGNLCVDTKPPNFGMGSGSGGIHAGYTITRGTGSLINATGVGDFNMDLEFTQLIPPPLSQQSFAATSTLIDMDGVVSQ